LSARSIRERVARLAASAGAGVGVGANKAVVIATGRGAVGAAENQGVTGSALGADREAAARLTIVDYIEGAV
jgi:hypothetical protein